MAKALRWLVRILGMLIPGSQFVAAAYVLIVTGRVRNGVGF